MLTTTDRSPALLFAASLALSACSGAVSPDRDGGSNGFITPDAGTNSGSGRYEGLVINEVAAAGDPTDWFELYNGGDEIIDLAGLTFTDDIAGAPSKGRFPAGSMLAPGGYHVQPISDEDTGFKLGGDEALGLFDTLGNLVDSVDWDEGQSPAGSSFGRIPNGTGDFKTLSTPTPGSANIDSAPTCGDGAIEGSEVCDGANLGGATCESLGLGAGTVICNAGCDGYDTTGCGAVASLLVLNELRSSGDDEIELFNRGTDAIDLEGYWLADSGYDPNDPLTDGQRYDVPAGTSIAAGGYLVLVKGMDHGFGLGGGGDTVSLYMPDDTEVDTVTYGADEAAVSYCRIPNGTGAFKPCAAATFGAENIDDGPRCGDDVREGNELCDGTDLGGEDCASQGFGSGTLACNGTCDGFDTAACVPAASTIVINEATSTGDDQVELFNTGPAAVDLSGWHFGDAGYDPTDPNTNGQRYDIGSGVTLGAGQYLVFAKGVDHTFGLGGDDAVTLYDAQGNVVDQADWPDDGAIPSYCRIPNGTGSFVTCGAASFGATNVPPMMAMCGNDMREGAEVCDGADLAGESCASQGFGGGTLDCNMTCDGFVTTGCTTATSTTVVINEVYYDAPSGDAPHVFTEIWGPAGLDLTGWSLVGINGTNGSPYRTLSLSGAIIPADGFLVVATAGAAGATLAARDFTADVDWQNGPDAVVLQNRAGATVDALQYGDASPNNAGEGTPAPDVAAGQTLSRDANHADTDDNAADFTGGMPTPGQ